MATQVPYEGKCFIALQEACVLVPYVDGKFKEGPRKGQLKYSNGYGNSDPALGPDSPPTTPEEAWAELGRDIEERQRDIIRWLDVEPTETELSALVSGYYQLGSKMKYVTNLINTKNPKDGKPSKNEACGVWSIYNRDGHGEFSAGLLNRRRMEIRLFQKGDYQLLVPDTFKPAQLKFWRTDPNTTKPEFVDFPPEMSETGGVV